MTLAWNLPTRNGILLRGFRGWLDNILASYTVLISEQLDQLPIAVQVHLRRGPDVHYNRVVLLDPIG